MNAVQERNSEMVNLLTPDFIRKKDSAYVAGLVAGSIMMLPGLVSYWPMGISLDHETTVYADEVMVGSSLNPEYKVEIIGGGAYGLSVDGAIRAGQGGKWGAIDGPNPNGWCGFGTNFYYNGNTPYYRATDMAAQIYISNQFLFRSAILGTVGTPITWLDIALLDKDGNMTLGDGSAPSGTLDVVRGLKSGGTAIFRGTNNSSHFNYDVAEDTYIRGGKTNSIVLIGDVNNVGGTQICNGGGPTTFGGRVGTNWTGLSFTAGWNNLGGGYTPCEYKRIGDMIFLRGLAQRSSGVSLTIGNLPAGYRPAYYSRLTTSSSDLYAEIEIRTDGDIVVLIWSPSWISLDGIWFSIL